MKRPEYTAKVDAVLDHCGGLTPAEWIELALACLDQAGLPATQQERVANLLRKFGVEVPS